MAKLFYRYGAMNSGKTTALIQVAFNYEERGMRVLVIKPSVDTKGGTELVSRIGVGRSVDMLILPEDNALEKIRAYNAKTPIRCVLADEAQFFTREQVNQLFELVVRDNIPVIAYGIRTDFLSNGFPGSTRLLELAHSIEELKTICACGKKAMMNTRKVNGRFVFEGEQVAIDMQNDVEYVALCPECYFSLRDAFERDKK